nr:MAG: putative polyprotein [Picornavirales sp.]
MSDNQRIQLSFDMNSNATAACRSVIATAESNAQQPESAMMSESRIDNQHSVIDITSPLTPYYNAPLSSQIEGAISEMKALAKTPVEKCELMVQMAEGFENDFLITRELIAKWKDEGADLFFNGRVVPHEDGDGDFAFEFADFIRDDDRWIACAAHRCLGALEACGYAWAPRCAYVKFNNVAANYVVSNLLKQQRGVRNVSRFLVQYHGGEYVPTRVVHHIVETMQRLYPLELSMYITSVTATNYHKRVPVFVQSEDQAFFEVVNDWYSVITSAQATRDIVRANEILYSVTPTYPESQGTVGAMWEIISAAASAVSAIIGNAKNVATALLSKFFHKLTKQVFGWLIADSFPVNIFAPVLGLINSVFKPLYERFAELIDFTTESLTPSSFVEAMNTGTTGQKISRWALGVVAFGVLAWIMYRLAVFTETVLMRLITSIYDALNFTGVFPEPFTVPQGPDSGVAPSVNVLSVIITLSVALFATTTRNSVIEAMKKFFGMVPGLQRGVGDALTSIVKLLPAGIARACALLSSDPSERLFSDMSAWILEATAVLGTGSWVAALVTREFQVRLLTVASEGHQLRVEYEKYSRSKDAKKFTDYSMFSRCLGKLEDMKTKMMSMNAMQTGRPEPVFLMIFGDAGSGKSQFISHISELFEGLVGFNGRRWHRPNAYCKALSDEYYSGLQQDIYQICVFDEIWRDSAVKDPNAPDMQKVLLDLISTTPYMPPMPAVEPSIAGSKGTTFNSTLVVGLYTDVFPADITVDPKALARRMLYTYEIDAPRVGSERSLAASPDTCYFVVLQDDIDKQVLPSTLNISRAGVYVAPKSNTGVVDYSKASIAMLDFSQYAELWRWRKHYVTYNAKMVHTPAATSVSTSEMVRDVMEGVEFRVARFLRKLEAAGLRYRTDFNGLTDKLRLAMITTPEEAGSKLDELFDDVTFEVNKFVADNQAKLAEQMNAQVVEIVSNDTTKQFVEAEEVYEECEEDPNEPNRAQGPTKMFSKRKTLKRTMQQVDAVRQADLPVTAAVLAMIPEPSGTSLPSPTPAPMPARRAQDMVLSDYPWVRELVCGGTSHMQVATGVDCSWDEPDEQIVRMFPTLRSQGHRDILREIFTRVHPNTADYIQEQNKNCGFKHRIGIIRSKYTTDGKYKYMLYVNGDAITRLEDLFRFDYRLADKERWEHYVDTCPIHFVNFWNDKTYADVSKQIGHLDRFALGHVTDCIISGPQDRCYYPYVLSYSDPHMLDVSESPVGGTWSYCSQCLRFFPPDYSPRSNVCLCAADGGCHRRRWLTCSHATDNLNSLAQSVPYGDYMYFCAMAANLLWFTCNSKYDSLIKIPQHELRHADHDSVSNMINHFAPSTRYLRLLEDNTSITTDYDDEDAVKGYESEAEVLKSTIRANYENPFRPATEITDTAVALTTSNWSIAKWLTVGAAVVGALVTVVKLVTRALNISDGGISAESALPKTITRVKHETTTPTKSRIAVWGRRNAQAQGASNEVTECMLRIDDSPAVRAFIPYSYYVFTYVHGIARKLLDGGNTVYVNIGGRQISFPFDDEQIVVDATRDICCFCIPRNVMNPHRDCLRQFAKRADLASGIGINAYLRIDRRDYIAMTALHGVFRYPTPGVRTDEELSSFTHNFGFCYPIHTISGDCGSLLRALDGPLAGQIIGYHVAAAKQSGNGSVGISAPLDRELLLEMIQAVEPAATSKSLQNQEPELQVVEDLNTVLVQGPVQRFRERLAGLAGPNLKSTSIVPVNERVNVPTKSSYHPTEFAEDDRFVGKYPSIMEPVPNGDPARNAFSELVAIDTPEIDERRLTKVAAQQLTQLIARLRFLGAARELSFKEAVAGIPSLLSSLRISTSAGYPLVLQGTKGKTNFVQITADGKVLTSKYFYNRVMALVDALRHHDRRVLESYPFYWLAFMKDELRPKKKIVNVATRMIYCNSLEWMVAARMLFGGLQVAFNNNAGRSIFSAGINVNSHDLQTIADYLGEVSLERCIAGDYSGFDKHYHPSFQRAAYANMRELGRACIKNFDAEAFDIFVEHELCPRVQFGDVRMEFCHSHFSGCFFTTAENCLVNELYFMYCFDQVYPNLDWNEETRFVALGDDHLVACSENIPNFNARTVCKLMESIGQVYTDENKMIPDYDYKPFEECGFLGSTPKLRDGRYAGALRLETLYSNLSHITKDTDFIALIETFLDLASVHDREVFEKYLNDVNDVWGRTHSVLFTGMYEARQRRQIERTANSGAGFWKPESPTDATSYFVSGQALGNPTPFCPDLVRTLSFDYVTPQGPGDMTQMQTEMSAAENQISGDRTDLHRAVGVHYASLTSPTQSPMYLTSFDWLSADSVDSLKLSLNLPGDTIKQAMQQTVPFQYYRYWHGDVELTFQVNGNNFQAGALVAVFCPLKTKAAAGVSRSNYLSGLHCILEPRQSTACTLRVPYRYFTDVMGTDGALNSTDVLGSLLIYVLSPLMSSSSTQVTVTIMVSFPDSQFYGPVVQQAIAQGPDGVTVGDLVGLIPGSDVVTKPIRKLNQLLDKKFIPMDDTPVNNGGLPVVNQFPGISSTVGAKPSVKPTLHPGSFYRKTERIFEADETKIASLCAREGIVRDFDWMVSQLPGTSLVQIPLNSICSDLPTASSPQIALPVNLAILNMFMYWHADLEFKLYVFKTPFHSGRIRVSLSLTNTADNFDTDELLAKQNMLFNQVLDYSDAECHTFVVPYIAAREFLYTAAQSQNTNTDKIGYLNIAVMNRLVTSTATVSSTVKCMLTVSLKNVRVAVPHPVPPVSFNGTPPAVTVQSQGPTDEAATVEDPNPAPVSFGNPDETVEPPPGPGELSETSHFMYAVEDLMELARRLEPFSLTRTSAGSATVDRKDGSMSSTILYPTLNNMMYDLFQAYSGGIRVRVLGTPMLYSFVPETVMKTKIVPCTLLEPMSYKGGELTTWTLADGTKVTTSSGVPNFTATEMAYPLPDGNYYIDVEIPYELPVNFYGKFNCIYYHTVQVEPYRPALLLSSFNKGMQGVAFMGAADDGLFGIFCPPQHSYFWWRPTDASLAIGALD